MMLPWLALWSTAVVVEGVTVCPSAAQVSDQLQALPVQHAASAPPDRALLLESADGLHLELWSSSGRLLAKRLLPRRRSCAELAAATAVVITIWERELAGAAPAVALERSAPP